MRAYLQRLPIRIATTVAVIIGWVVAYLGAPVFVSVALLWGLIADRRRLRWLRVFGFVFGLLTNEVVGLIVSFGSWVITGFGLANRTRYGERISGALIKWWTHNVMALVCFFADTTLVVSGEEALEPSPVIVLSRHISFLDAAVPAVLITDAGRNTPRHVFMRELRFDPCIETAAYRSPNYFVNRGGGAKERTAIEQLGTTLGPHAAGVIFPEGGFRTARRFQRAIESLRRRKSPLASTAAHLRYVMPPRPGGSYAFFDGAPSADGVVVAHAGFDSVSTVAQIIRGLPISRPVMVEIRRVARQDIPSDSDAFAAWLMAQFVWIDDVVSLYERTIGSPAPAELDMTADSNRVAS